MNLKDGINKVASLYSNMLDTNISVWILVDGKEYEVEQFKIGFSQASDHKGEPQSETKGGQLMVTLTQGLPDNFYEWAIKPGMRKDGVVSFKIQTGSAPLRVEFFNAACVNFSRTMNQSEGLQTYLVLSPERLLVNDTWHDNNWVE